MSELQISQQVRNLKQYRPPNTSAISVIQTNPRRKVVIKSINIANTTAADATFSLYLDNDGTTYDATTAIAMSVLIEANSLTLIEYAAGLPLEHASNNGNFAVQSNTTNALTFTISGIEV